RDEITEITFTQGMARGSAPRDGTPVFRSQTSGRGITEVSFSLTDSAGSTISGRASFAGSPPDTAATLRAGSAVNVVFRKGPITIEMPGKALVSAALGQQVSVQLSDSRKTFTGFLTSVKEVQVDLP
ncbi:MAG TPA: flagella basal body P-ring formation protein FlgA, partial [Spirochaetia bacterium]